MNNNMYNQPNGGQNVGQNISPQNIVQTPQPVQPMVQPGAPATNVSKSAGAAVNNLKNTISNIDKDSAKKYIGMGSGALLLLSTFLPYMSKSVYGMKQSVSLWESGFTVVRILFLVFALIPIATFFLQKAKSLSYLTAGFSLCFAMYAFDFAEGASMSFGFYFMFIASIALIVLCVMDDLAEIKSMFITKPKVTTGGNVTTNMQVPPTAPSVPSTPAPVAPATPVQPMPAPVQQMATPVQQPVAMPSVVPNGPVQPVVQNVEVCNFCGQPKKNPTDVVCPSCGQRY